MLSCPRTIVKNAEQEKVQYVRRIYQESLRSEPSSQTKNELEATFQDSVSNNNRESDISYLVARNIIHTRFSRKSIINNCSERSFVQNFEYVAGIQLSEKEKK